MEWCSVKQKKAQGQLYLLLRQEFITAAIIIIIIIIITKTSPITK